MTTASFLVHLGNFVAPALVTALLLALVPLGQGKVGRLAAYARRMAKLFLVGVLVLVAGLLLFSRDGRMVTYAMLVVAQGSLMWFWQQRAEVRSAGPRRVKRSRSS